MLLNKDIFFCYCVTSIYYLSVQHHLSIMIFLLTEVNFHFKEVMYFASQWQGPGQRKPVQSCFVRFLHNESLPIRLVKQKSCSFTIPVLISDAMCSDSIDTHGKCAIFSEVTNFHM